jgi:hypothetical protein
LVFILQKYGLPYRHNQLANIESLNGQLSRFIHGYLNSKDEKNKKSNKHWTDILPIIRDKLNKIREKKLPDDPYKSEIVCDLIPSTAINCCGFFSNIF